MFITETFVKDIREDFSNLVHCNLAWIYPIVWYQMKTKCRSPDFQDNVNLVTWLLGFGNVCIDSIGRKKTTEISVKQPLVTSHRFSRKWNQKLQENTSLILFVTGIRWQIIMYKSWSKVYSWRKSIVEFSSQMQQSNTSRIQPTEQALLFCFSPRFFLILILIFVYFRLLTPWAVSPCRS